MAVAVRHLRKFDGETVSVRGWLADKREIGEIAILEIRDGSGFAEAVVRHAEVSEEAWQSVADVTLESTVRVTGIARSDEDSSGRIEIQVTDFAVKHRTDSYPIETEEHGVEHLMAHRHLWLRSKRQRAVLAVRHEVCQALRDFFYDQDFVLVDSPILTPAVAEDRSTPFEADYFDTRAYLAQSGQLYLEPACAAFGKVYCMGPTFRAEPSTTTRRHLTEFWMAEPEVAFMSFEGALHLAEELVCYLVGRVLERCGAELGTLERDTSKLEKVAPSFPVITYGEAVEILKSKGSAVVWGDDLGAEDEKVLAAEFDRPVFVTRFPKATRAFYMEPDPENADLVLAMDLLAPEGYGEIAGGSQRIHDHDLLLQRLGEHDLPVEPFQWYLDVRKYGTFPHSGFGLGIERFVAWVSGVEHVGEAIPYPRARREIYP